jgi:hypothetical protein
MRELIRELTHVHLRRTYDARLFPAEQNQPVVFVCVVARRIYSARARLHSNPAGRAARPRHRRRAYHALEPARARRDATPSYCTAGNALVRWTRVRATVP